MARGLRATGELVWCGSVMASTCWCLDLTGTANVREFLSRQVVGAPMRKSQENLTTHSFSFFYSRSERGLYLYSASSLSAGAVSSIPVNVSPSTLIPYYDPDTSVVILTGKVSTQTEIFPLHTHCSMK